MDSQHFHEAIRRLALAIAGVLTLFALYGCTLLGLPSSDNTDSGVAKPQAGTITLTLDGASTANGSALYVLAYDKGEWRIDMPAYVRGAGQAEITSGAAECVLRDSIDANWVPSGQEWTATAGAEYDLYVYVLDGSTGEMQSVLQPWPISPDPIDGNKVVAVDYTDLVDYVPTDGTLTLTLSGGSAYAGKTIYMGVLTPGEDPTATDPLADGSAVISGEGTATMVAQSVPGGGTWTGTGDAEYDVYAFIDMNNNGEANGPDDGDLLYNPAPVTYWQFGDKVMRTRAADFEVYSVN